MIETHHVGERIGCQRVRTAHTFSLESDCYEWLFSREQEDYVIPENSFLEQMRSALVALFCFALRDRNKMGRFSFPSGMYCLLVHTIHRDFRGAEGKNSNPLELCRGLQQAQCWCRGMENLLWSELALESEHSTSTALPKTPKKVKHALLAW